jgi:tyrosyl-tRNA synthetase
VIALLLQIYSLTSHAGWYKSCNKVKVSTAKLLTNFIPTRFLYGEEVLKFEKNHPYARKLDEVLSHYFIVKTDVPAVHGEEYEDMKQLILDSLFTNYLGNTIRK